MMVDLSPFVRDIFVSAKFKAYLSEAEGSELVASLEQQHRCVIHVVGNSLMISHQRSMTVDASKIEKILRESWNSRDVRRTVREAALNATCSHQCKLTLTKAQAAVISVYVTDIKRRSRVNDILVDNFDGKISIFGSESTVSSARQFIQLFLMEHFGPLNAELPKPSFTERYINSNVSGQSTPLRHDRTSQSSYENLETSFQRDDLAKAFESQLNISRTLQKSEKIGANLEKIRLWIANSDVSKLVGHRGQTWKKLEMDTKCIILIRKECESFGMMAIDIIGLSKSICQFGREVIEKYLHSTPDASPIRPTSRYEFAERRPDSEAKAKRNAFRNQPKVLLELSPRKTPKE